MHSLEAKSVSRNNSFATKQSSIRRPLNSTLPVPLRTKSWCFLLLLMIGVVASLETTLHNNGSRGWALSPWFATTIGGKSLLRLSLQYGCAQLLSLAWAAIVGDILWLQPLLNLRTGNGDKAEKTIFEDYVRESRIVVFLNSLRRREFMVTLAVLISLLTIPLQPLFGALLSTDTMIINYSEENSTAISQLSQNVSDSFSDLKPFVLAANLATIKTILKVGALPFISDDGYTVEEFTLPPGINGTGTATANVSAVFYQASCVEPDAVEVNSTETTASLLSNTAWFGDCFFSWNASDSGPSSGIGVLPDVEECTQYSQLAPQHRPVVFFYSVFSPAHLATASMCIPEIHVSSVQVSVNLATNETSVVTKTDVASPIAGANAVLNGLFLDTSSLDQAATARLQNIQQDLASAVLDTVQALQGAGSVLEGSFANHAFTKTTTDVYNTYLRVLARGIYFSPEQNAASVPVQLSAEVTRVMLDAAAVHSLSCVLGATVVLGFFLLTIHKHMRRRLPFIPPYFGTIGAAAGLMGNLSVDVSTRKTYYLSKSEGWRIVAKQPRKS
ncbi:hypothetical protein K466DRAFT_313631 [Polyporus arcularius HHB13444]|uniref:Transmembrane protein n=1 Tax=Polyporus arcularius HHB13444 TaxID=1314778 RepID=A0A5C3PSE6_9APHY|nr:hypothetical protein K466DRAFT_313631 [Polyporus arcularius HHB13444]